MPEWVGWRRPLSLRSGERRHIAYTRRTDCMHADDEEEYIAFHVVQYERDFHAVRDMGVRSIIGLNVLETYSAIRRHVWRKRSEGHPGAIEMRAAGKVVSVVSQKRIAEYVDRSFDHVKKDIAFLRKGLGWLDVVQIDKSGARAFVVGFHATEPGKKPDPQHDEEVFFADLWMRKLWTALVKHAVNDLGKPVKDLSMRERRAFCESYIEPLRSRAKMKIVGGEE